MATNTAYNPFPSPADSTGLQTIVGGCSENLKVNLLSGNLLANVTVVNVPTIGAPLSFYLTYNSLDSVSGVVGNKWRHNYMMGLTITGSPATYVTYTNPTGRQFGFTKSGGNWVLDTGSAYGYYSGVLTNPSSNWQITMPDGSYYVFNSSGQLTSMVDLSGNTTSLSYSGGNLSTITEPKGRQISLSYSGGLLQTITDPRSKSTSLTFDANNNLTVVTAPTGCTTTYGYSTPSNHFMTSKTDARSNTYSITYSSSLLSTVTDPTSSNILTYTYDTVSELVGTSTNATLNRTKLLDAAGNTWEYRFDLSGNLRRIIDPAGKGTLMYWDQIVSGQGISQQKMIYKEAGFPPTYPGSFRFATTWRYAYDSTNNNGDLLYSVDPNGAITQYTYDSNQNLLSVYPAQANMGVQGNWVGQYGNDGWILTSFFNANGDEQSLPTYVAGVSLSSITRTHIGETSGTFDRLMDPRTLVDATTMQRGVGFWKFSGSSPQITISLNASKSFNLSLYTCATDLGYAQDTPLGYEEQFGHDNTITVTDKNGTYSFRVYNNAPGVWVTFPVTGDASHAITVTVVASGSNTDARISALTFDPYDNHRTTYTYDGNNRQLTSTDGLGNVTTKTYNGDGNLATLTDANSHEMQYFYEDTYHNLTRIVDATGAQSSMTYDANGNVLTKTDPNLRVTVMTYDDKNRLLTTTDPMGDVTTLQYDNVGNMTKVTDPNSNQVQYTYSSTNRITQVTDALSNTTNYKYDGRGYITSFTDANGNTTSYTTNSVGRLTTTTLPDGNTITYVYDGLGLLRSSTSTNGNQATLSSINLTNAYNWLRNAGAESASKYDSTQAQAWTSSPAGGTRDSSVSHSGSASLKLGLSSGTQYWTQAYVPIPAGVSALMQFWGRPDGTANTSTIWSEVLNYDMSGSGTTSHASSTTTLPASSTSWVQTPLYSFNIPGDGAYDYFSVAEVRMHGQSSVSMNAWFDDAALYSTSVGYSYDKSQNLTDQIQPDGAHIGYIHDRFGRISAISDPRGSITSTTFDSNGRVLTITDALGNKISYAWDGVGNMSSSTDQNGNATQYTYDNVNRLTKITYPDTTTEQFGYDSAGNLHSYTNNRSQVKVFGYDGANRLVFVQYQTDFSYVFYRYDANGNTISRIERNGDYLQLVYDANNRLTETERVPHSSSGVWWIQSNTYDGNGNRIQFNSGAATPTPVYDTAQYDDNSYATAQRMWSVPSPGFNSRNRMPAFIDANNKETWFAYDIENRPTKITYPSGSTTPVTQQTYDIVGKLLTGTTSAGGNLLSQAYDYDLTPNRIGAVMGSDTFVYEVDATNRLVAEHQNTFAEDSFYRFSLGTASQCTADPVKNTIALVPFADALTATEIDVDRWRPAYTNQSFVGYEIRPMTSGLQFCFPRGFSDAASVATFLPYGLNSNTIWGAVEHRQQLSGDFDVTVDFSDYQGKSGFGTTVAAMYVSPNPIEQLTAASPTYASIAINNTPQYKATVVTSGTTQVSSTASTSDTSGKFRIARSSSTITLYYWNTGTGVWSSLGTYASYSTASTYVSLYFSAQSSAASVGFTNFGFTSSSTLFPSSGTYTSSVFDAGQSVTWNTLLWTAALPTNTSIEFQIATSSSFTGPFSYIGPDGTSGTYFTTLPATLSSVTGRYMSYQATLATSDGASTPTLDSVYLEYTGTDTSQLLNYAYDPAGNLTRKQSKNDSTTTLEVRNDTNWSGSDQINNLNQIIRNDVFSSPRYDHSHQNTDHYALPTTYRYVYDASGNVTSKTPYNYITGTLANGSNNVTSVSAGDIALLYVGAPVANAALPANTTVSTIGANSFTVNHNATANATATQITVTQAATTYTWNEDNRLTQVTLPSSATITYTYDVSGRMLTRADSSGTTQFEWDGFDCVRETAPSSGTAVFDTATFDNSANWGTTGLTQYYVIGGNLLELMRDNARYSVITDAVGSVRLVLNSNGSTVSSFQYDAWGNLLSSSSDSLSVGGMPYQFVGGLGVRQDSGSGLTYMRQRWYSPNLQRFLSRDPLPTLKALSRATVRPSSNLYDYTDDSPSSLVDPSGKYTTIPSPQKGSSCSLAGILFNPDGTQTCQYSCTGDSPYGRIPILPGKKEYNWGAAMNSDMGPVWTVTTAGGVPCPSFDIDKLCDALRPLPPAPNPRWNPWTPTPPPPTPGSKWG